MSPDAESTPTRTTDAPDPESESHSAKRKGSFTSPGPHSNGSLKRQKMDEHIGTELHPDQDRERNPTGPQLVAKQEADEVTHKAKSQNGNVEEKEGRSPVESRRGALPDRSAPSMSGEQKRRPSLQGPGPGPGPGSGPGPGPVATPAAPASERRRNFSQEEKKRGQRLFGSLLSTLSQTSSSSQQKKRLEIERRQQEKAQQQRDEYDRRRVEQLAKLHTARKIEQLKFEEQVMQSRHSNMLAMAHHLQTQSEPKIYYRPWELSGDQENTIKEQLHRVQEVIEKESQDFKLGGEQRLKDLGATVGEAVPCGDANNRAPAQSSSSSNKTGSHDKDHDEPGDVMVEAEEDTVIY